MAATRVHMVISGRVQGVFYRDYTVAEAERLGLRGWVRNLRDGTVELEAEGEAGALALLEAWCRSGSPMSKVTTVESTPIAATGAGPGFRRKPTPRR
jgi:acylphosphatase